MRLVTFDSQQRCGAQSNDRRWPRHKGFHCGKKEEDDNFHGKTDKLQIFFILKLFLMNRQIYNAALYF